MNPIINSILNPKNTRSLNSGIKRAIDTSSSPNTEGTNSSFGQSLFGVSQLNNYAGPILSNLGSENEALTQFLSRLTPDLGNLKLFEANKGADRFGLGEVVLTQEQEQGLINAADEPYKLELTDEQKKALSEERNSLIKSSELITAGDDAYNAKQFKFFGVEGLVKYDDSNPGLGESMLSQDQHLIAQAKLSASLGEVSPQEGAKLIDNLLNQVKSGVLNSDAFKKDINAGDLAEKLTSDAETLALLAQQFGRIESIDGNLKMSVSSDSIGPALNNQAFIDQLTRNLINRNNPDLEEIVENRVERAKGLNRDDFNSTIRGFNLSFEEQVRISETLERQGLASDGSSHSLAGSALVASADALHALETRNSDLTTMILERIKGGSDTNLTHINLQSAHESADTKGTFADITRGADGAARSLLATTNPDACDGNFLIQTASTHMEGSVANAEALNTLLKNLEDRYLKEAKDENDKPLFTANPDGSYSDKDRQTAKDTIAKHLTIAAQDVFTGHGNENFAQTSKNGGTGNISQDTTQLLAQARGKSIGESNGAVREYNATVEACNGAGIAENLAEDINTKAKQLKENHDARITGDGSAGYVTTSDSDLTTNETVQHASLVVNKNGNLTLGTRLTLNCDLAKIGGKTNQIVTHVANEGKTDLSDPANSHLVASRTGTASANTAAIQAQAQEATDPKDPTKDPKRDGEGSLDPQTAYTSNPNPQADEAWRQQAAVS